jgi:hypothetical protein
MLRRVGIVQSASTYRQVERGAKQPSAMTEKHQSEKASSHSAVFLKLDRLISLVRKNRAARFIHRLQFTVRCMAIRRLQAALLAARAIML